MIDKKEEEENKLSNRLMNILKSTENKVEENQGVNIINSNSNQLNDINPYTGFSNRLTNIMATTQGLDDFKKGIEETNQTLQGYQNLVNSIEEDRIKRIAQNSNQENMDNNQENQIANVSASERKNQIKSKEEIDKQIKNAKNQSVSVPNANNKIIDNDMAIGLANEKETQNAQELSMSDINAMQEANKKNKNLEKGGVEAFNEWTNTVLDNIYGGAKQSVAGLANVVTTLTALGIKGLEGASRIVGLEEQANSLKDARHDVVDFGSNISEQANYERNINSRVENDFVKTSGDVSNVISNMLTNTAIGYVTGVSGTVAQGLSVGGSSAQEVLDENKDNVEQATLTGIAKGYVSYLTEKMFDANILTRGTRKTSIQEGINRLISNRINSKFGKEVANRIVGILGENVEELAEDNAGYLIDKLINDKDLPGFEEWWNNTTETAKTTTLSTMIMGLLGLGGESFNDIEMDIETEYWIDQAQQIIEKENLAIHFNPSEVKNLNETEPFYITRFTQDGELANIVPTQGKPIYNPKTELNVIPVVVKDSETNFYSVIDGNTGVILDNTYYETTMEAEGGFNEKANKLTDLQVKDINTKIDEANYLITDKIINTITEAKEQLAQDNITFKDNNTNYTQEQIDNINVDISQTSQKQNTDNLQQKETSYSPQDIKKITEPFNSQEEYTKNEMAEVWNDEIARNEYDVSYDEDGNIQNYIAIEEDGNILTVSLYDNNDNIVKSETISNVDGKYTSNNITSAIEKISGLYDENYLQKGKAHAMPHEKVSNMLFERYPSNSILQNEDIIKSVENFERAKETVNRKDVLNIANSLNIKLKNGATIITDTDMSKRAGKNNNPKIIEITKLFENVTDRNAKQFRQKAIDTAMELFRDIEVNIIDTNSIAEINRKGIRKTFSGTVTASKIQTANDILNIIQEGIYNFTTQNLNDTQETLYHHFFAPVKYNEENGLIRVVIKEFPKDIKQMDKFYYHQLEYINNKKIKRLLGALPHNDMETRNIKPSPSIDNSIPQKTKTVKSDRNTAINKSTQKAENNTNSFDQSIRSMKKGNENTVENNSSIKNEDIRFAKRTAKSQNENIDKTQRNAERQGAYIEQEIQKIEKTGDWDNSIPVTKMTDIRKTIEDYLGLGVKKGHFRQDAYAIYKGNRDVIRTKEYKDIDSILHETGHALDIGNRLKVDKESIASELLTAIDKLGGYEQETKAIRLEEGFAEVIREYTIIPEQAKIEYPQTIAILEKLRQNDKGFNNFISKVQEQTYNYIHQNPRNRTVSNQSIGEQTDKTPWTKEWVKQEVMRNVWDKDYALKSAVTTLQKAGGQTSNQLNASDNAYYLTRLASGIGDKVSSMLADGYIDTDGNKIMPGLNQIGEILGNNPERFNDLRAYLLARRDTDYKSKALKTGVRTTDSMAVIEQFKNDTQIQEASKVIYDTLDGVMQYVVDNGLITQEVAENLKESNAFYVPMQRVIENRGNQVGRRGAVADVIKKRTGSELDVKDILENIVSNSSNMIQQVENNNILRALYKQGEESGITSAIYDVIDTPMAKVGTANLETWRTELERQGVDTSVLDLEKTMDLFAPNNKVDRQNLITSFIDENGKRVYLQFNDELIFNSIMNMDKKFMSQVLNITSKLNMPLRYGATMANIGFAIPNMISDTAQASIYSTAGFIPVVDNALGVLDVLAANNKTVGDFLNKVAPEYAKRINTLYTIYNQTGSTSSTRLSQYRKSTQSVMKDIYGTKKSETLGIKESFKPLKRLLDLMTYIPELSEQSTRFEVFKKNYEYYSKKGYSEMDTRIMAALEARDATQDFGRTGNATREINQLIPFSAARVGSAYTFAEKVKANPKQVGMRIAVLMALGMAIKGLSYDDKEIEELNQRKKDDNFVFKIGDKVITIKKPQGILRSMLNLGEYIQDLATGHIEEGKEGERLGEWLNNAIMDNMPADSVTGLVPNMVAPLIENAINKDFYYNTDIVKSYDLELPDKEQYYDYNSQLAIFLGKLFNYSPAKIDNLISGYFGGLGTQVTNMMDTAFEKFGIIAQKPEMGAESNAVGKRFVVNVNTNSASIDEIYNKKTELTKKKNGGEITEKETAELESITEAISNMSKVNKQIKEIKKDLSMSGKRKADEIKLLQQQKTDIARQALGKDLLYNTNANKVQSITFYPSNSTLKKNGRSLELTSSQKEEYEKIASEYYNKNKSLHNKDKLDTLKNKAKDYAKNQLMQKYKSNLVKTKK